MEDYGCSCIAVFRPEWNQFITNIKYIDKYNLHNFIDIITKLEKPCYVRITEANTHNPDYCYCYFIIHSYYYPVEFLFIVPSISPPTIFAFHLRHILHYIYCSLLYFDFHFYYSRILILSLKQIPLECRYENT